MDQFKLPNIFHICNKSTFNTVCTMFKAKLNSSRHVIFHKPCIKPITWVVETEETKYIIYSVHRLLKGHKSLGCTDRYCFRVIFPCRYAVWQCCSKRDECVCVYVGFSGGWEEFISESLCWEYCCHNELVFTLRSRMGDRIWCIVTAPFDAHLSFTCPKK